MGFSIPNYGLKLVILGECRGLRAAATGDGNGKRGLSEERGFS